MKDAAAASLMARCGLFAARDEPTLGGPCSGVLKSFLETALPPTHRINRSFGNRVSISTPGQRTRNRVATLEQSVMTMATRTKSPVAAKKSTPTKRIGRPPGAKNKPRVAEDDPNRFESIDPLDFLKRQVNDRTLDPRIRQRAAIAAAQYTHRKRGYNGKKEEKQTAAEKAVREEGGFSPMAAPTHLKEVK